MIRRSKFRALALSAFVAIGALATATAFAQTHEDPHGEVPAGHDPALHAPAGHDPAAHAPGGHDPAATADHGMAEHDGHDAHAAAAGAHAGGHHGPEPINWTDLSDKRRPAFIALLINFGLLAGLYYFMGKKPVAEGLKQRRITIGKEIEDARAMLAEAKERAKKYQSKLQNVDADALTAKSALVASGKGEVEQLLVDARERGERMNRDASRLVEQERKQLQQDLVIETVELAVKEAKDLLEKSATQEDHARLANELLAELARKPAAARASGGVS